MLTPRSLLSRDGAPPYSSDRGDLFLPAWQSSVAAALGAANPNTVVVARCPGACHLPFSNAVGAVLFELLPGQESGNSIGE